MSRAGIALAAVAVVLGVLTGAPEALPPCASEDGSGGPVPCVWDASERGNGRGADVTVSAP